MKKKQQSQQENKDGFSSLIDAYTYALQDNTEIISQMLEELAKRKLSKKDKDDLKKISREFNSIENQINKLGK